MEQKTKIIKSYREEEVVKSFDKDRSRYAYQRYKHKIESRFLDKTIWKVKKSRTEDPSIKVLDVACGTGRMLRTLKDTARVIDYTGLDTSKEMLLQLNKKSKDIYLYKVKTKIGDATKIPFPDKVFDVTYTYHLLWHLPEREQRTIIKEMIRVTKKGGYVIFDVLNDFFIYEGLKLMMNKESTKGIYKTDIQDLKHFLRKYNYKIEKLCDFPIKNDKIYSIANILNNVRRVMPLGLFHMVYIRVNV